MASSAAANDPINKIDEIMGMNFMIASPWVEVDRVMVVIHDTSGKTFISRVEENAAGAMIGNVNMNVAPEPG